MLQNVKECSDAMIKIKKRLEDGGYNIINVNTINSTSTIKNIFIKTPKVGIRSYTTTTKATYDDACCTAISNPRKVCPYNAGATIDVDNRSCTYTGECKVHHSNCPIKNGNTSGGSSSSGTTGSTNTAGDYLLRILPTDIQNGIFLHVIILHGEHCDLKMTFNCDVDGIQDLLNTIKFLIG